MRFSKITLLVLMTCSAASSAWAQEHRQHGAHEHGGGQLNVALEKNQLMVDLSLPAMNVVGFEHAAKTQLEQDQLTQAVSLLKDGISLMAPSVEAGCKLENVTVESALLDEHHEEHGNDEHEHHDEEDGHADFDVSYEFNCKQSAKLNQLTLELFKQFPATQHLKAQVITATRQGGAELTADSNILKLK